MATDALTQQLSSLTPEQYAAVQAIVNPPPGIKVVRLLAGAGSGKTRVITVALALLAEKAGVSALATTFTKKGQQEMEQRTLVLLQGSSGTAQVATLNALAMRYALSHGLELARKLPEVCGHQFQPGYQLDGAHKHLPLGDVALANRIAGKRRFGKAPYKGAPRPLVEIPGLAGSNFYGLAVNGDPKDPDPDYHEALTDERPASYLQTLSLFRSRGWVGGEPEANIYIRVIEGDPDAVSNLRNLQVDPMTEAWRDWCLSHAGRFPEFGRFWFYYQSAKQSLQAWDFLDTLYVFWRYGDTAASRVLVDEAQDSSWLQMQIELGMAERGNGVLCVIGDVRQCIPAGQMISTPQGPRAVEAVRVGDTVLSAIGGRETPCAVVGKRTTQVDEAWEFTLEDGRTFQTTDSHACFAAIGRPTGYYVYLMYRDGYGFRVGSTSATGDKSLEHLIVRTQQEQAQRLWLLGVCETAAGAHRMEHTLAYRWRVPMAPFKPRPGTMFDTTEQAAGFFHEFACNGMALLEHYKLRFDRPAYIAKSTHQGGVAVNLILGCGKTAGRPGVAKVEVESQHIPDALLQPYGFRATKSGCWRLRRESPDAVRMIDLATHLMDALTAAGVRAHIAETLSVPGADRRVFCTAASGLVPGMLVPAADAAGYLGLVRIVARRRVPAQVAYDLEVDQSATFLVNGVAVHNSIFSFQGAMPSFMSNMPRVYPTHTSEITTNFRSRRRIVMLGNAIADGQSWMVGSPSLSARREDGVLQPGVVEVRAGGEEMSTVESLAEAIAERISIHGDPGRHAVLCRVHSHADLFEMALLRLGIPIVRLGKKRTFFDTNEAKKVISYLFLASNPAGMFPAAVRSAPGGSLLGRIALGEEHHMRYIGKEAFQGLADDAVAAKQTDLLAGLRWMRAHAPDGTALARGMVTLVQDVERVMAAEWPRTLDVIEGLLVAPQQHADTDEDTDSEDDEEEDPQAVMRNVLATIRKIAESRTLRELGEFINQSRTAASTVVRFSGSAGDTAFATEYDNVKKSCVTLATIHTCLSPSTLVVTDHGAQRIRDTMATGRIAVGGRMVPYQNRVEYTDCNMLRIRTKRGYEIEVTTNHGLASWRPCDAAATRRTGEDLRVGDHLILPLTQRPVVPVPLPLPPDGMDVRTVQHTIPTELTPDLGEVLGLMVGDGTVFSRGFRLTKRYRSVADRFAALCQALFGVEAAPVWVSGNQWAVTVSSVQLSQWLLEIRDVDGAPALKPNAKAVPACILTATAGTQAGFLRGLFEDGTVNRKEGGVDHVAYTTTMPEVARLVQWMLLGLGIASRRFRAKAATDTNADTWRVDVPGGFCALFAERIGFTSTEKREQLQGCDTSSDYPVPLARDTLPVAYRGVDLSTYQNVRSRGCVSRGTAEKLIAAGLLPEGHLDVLYEPIESIEPFVGPSMCVEVPDGGRFTQNGFDGFNSKGLEWPEVTVMVQDGKFPMSRGDPEEERRLFYVAATRAENHLTIGCPTALPDGRPLSMASFASLTTRFILRDDAEMQLLRQGVGLGWLAPKEQEQIADGVIVWSHPHEDVQVRLDLMARRLDRVEGGRATTVMQSTDHVPKEEWLGGRPPLFTDRVIAYLQDSLDPDPEPIEVGPLSELAATRREAFHEVLWPRGLDPDQADNLIDYATPMLTQDQLTARLGWSTVGHLAHIARAASPLVYGEAPIAVRHAGGVTLLWQSPTGPAFSGDTPVDPANPHNAWGVPNEERTEVVWMNGVVATVPVLAPMVTDSSPALPGLRLVAYEKTTKDASDFASADVTIGPMRIEEHPKGSGSFRLMEDSRLIATGSHRAALVAEAYQRQTVGPPHVETGPHIKGQYKVGTVLRGQEGIQIIAAESGIAALQQVVAQREPRWAAYVPTAGARASDPAAHWSYTDPAGGRYAVALRPMTPEAVVEAVTTEAVEVPVAAPAAAQEALVAPSVLSRPWTVATLPPYAYPAVGMRNGVLMTEMAPPQPEVPVRYGSLFLSAPPQAQERDLLRADVQEGRVIFEVVLSYAPPPGTLDLDTAQERIREFYAQAGKLMARTYDRDALAEHLKAHPLLPDAALLVRALWEIAPDGGFSASPTGGIRTASGQALPRCGSNGARLLPLLVDNGCLLVVGDTYAWSFNGGERQEGPPAGSRAAGPGDRPHTSPGEPAPTPGGQPPSPKPKRKRKSAAGA